MSTGTNHQYYKVQPTYTLHIASFVNRSKNSRNYLSRTRILYSRNLARLQKSIISLSLTKSYSYTEPLSEFLANLYEASVSETFFIASSEPRRIFIYRITKSSLIIFLNSFIYASRSHSKPQRNFNYCIPELSLIIFCQILIFYFSHATFSQKLHNG